MRLLKTIQLDVSDTLVFEHAAMPGEWAVTGSFLFMNDDLAQLGGKRRAAFRQGFAGVSSLGFSTLAIVTLVQTHEVEQATQDLAQSLLDQLGAPDLMAALEAARDEIRFSASLCMNGTEPYPEGTVIAMTRSHEDGEITEQFRSLSRRQARQAEDDWHSDARAFSIIEVDDTDAVEERIDLVALIKDEDQPS